MMQNYGKLKNLFYISCQECLVMFSLGLFLLQSHFKNICFSYRFLHQKDSNAYIQYRQLVGRLRREAQRADDSDDEGDSYPDREHQKNLILKRSSPSYGKDNSHSHKNENGQPSNVLGGSSQGGKHLIYIVNVS